MKKSFFYTLFFFFCIIFCTNNTFAQVKPKPLTPQEKAEQEKMNKNFIGKWWNGMEMGGITLYINVDGSYIITEDMQEETIEKGKWTAIKNAITFVSEANNKTVLFYFTNADVENRSKIALRGKGCANMKGFCYFKAKE